MPALAAFTTTLMLHLSFSATAKEIASAKELVANIHDERNRDYLRAVKEGLDWANVRLVEKHQPLLFCQPPKMALTLDQLSDILQRYVDDKQHSPLLADFPVRLVLLDALQEVFPCPPNDR